LATEAQVQSEGISAQTEASGQKDSSIALSIRTLHEEAMQLSELQEMEKNYSIEVSSLLKLIIEPLNASYHVKPTVVSSRDSSLSDVVVTPQGIVNFIHSQGIMNAKPLETLPSEVLVRILGEVIPQIKQILIEKRQKVSVRVGTLEKISREFKKIAPAYANKGRPQITTIPPQSQRGATAFTPVTKEKVPPGQTQSAMKAAISE